MFKLNIKNLSIFTIIIVVIVVFFGFYINNKRNISNSDISVKFESSDIVTIDSKLAISDLLGKSLTNDTTEDGVFGFVDFSVINNTSKQVNFEINLVKQNVIGPVIKDNYIKLYLTDTNDKEFGNKSLIPNFNQLNNSKSNNNGKTLFVDSLAAKEKKKFRLRAWLSDSYIVSDVKESFSFDVNVDVI